MIIKLNNARGKLSPDFSVHGHKLTNANGDIETTLSGFKFITSTMSEIMQEEIEQKHMEVPFADYVPVDVGGAPDAEEIIRKVTFQTGGDFHDGDINTSTSTSRMASVDVAMTPLRMPIKDWAKDFTYNIVEIAKAAASSNWDLLAGKTKSLKKNWDLGLQEICFLGHPGVSELTGLLNSDEVNSNSSVISTKKISEMTSAEFQTFIGQVVSVYVDNSENTSKPDTFVIPTDDFLGLASAASDNNPAISKLEYLQKALAATSGNKNFTILDLAYCQKERNEDFGINSNRYVMYKNDPDVLTMAIPVDFTLLEAETINNFNFTQVAYGRYSGTMITRPKEVMYFDRA